MGKQTPFYAFHVKQNAKIVDFSGWDMPLHYGSQIEEHHHVRQDAGMFDVSHMGIVDLQGEETCTFLRRLLANDIDRLTTGKALYTCMLNEKGGVIDDLIVYKIADDLYRLVINAGTREKDIAWIKKQAQGFTIQIKERSDLAMLAIQGPFARKKISALLTKAQTVEATQLKPFHFLIFDDLFIACTGYTGEDGYELIFKAEQAEHVWSCLLQAGIFPCGLGARDTLRLEAGLNLYGADMDESVTPLEANLAWTVAMDPQDRNFIGRDALQKQKQQGIKRRLVGLILEGSGIMRNHQKVKCNHEEGEITSGGYSPTLKKSIALARIPIETSNECFIDIRTKWVPAKVVKPPFVKHGKKCFEV